MHRTPSGDRRQVLQKEAREQTMMPMPCRRPPMASWREGGKTRNVHLASARKMDAAAARQKARDVKAEALHAN